MHKNATKCNETLSKWCKNKHGASKIIDTFEMYQSHAAKDCFGSSNLSLHKHCLIILSNYFVRPGDNCSVHRKCRGIEAKAEQISCNLSPWDKKLELEDNLEH
jgi:hypothetical protein